MKLCVYIFVIAQFFTIASANNSVKLQQQFKAAYQSYKTSLNLNDLTQQKTAAEEAYELGRKLYGDTHINSAKLALNYVVTLHKLKEFKHSDELESFIAQIYKDTYGEESKELIDLYYSFSKSIGWNDNSKRKRYLSEALDIADEAEEKSPLLAAATRLSIGKEYINLGSKKGKVVLKALDYLSNKFPKNDTRVVEAKFWAGRYYLSFEKRNNAIEMLTSNLPIFDKIEGATHPLELATHAFLVQAYEGKRMPDEATKHTLAIGRMTPWDDSQEATPIYRVNPRYPLDMARKGISGYVVFEFTITESGTIDDVETIEYDGKAFIKEGKLALKQWRFAPKFVDGKTVAAKKQTVRLDFTLG